MHSSILYGLLAAAAVNAAPLANPDVATSNMARAAEPETVHASAVRNTMTETESAEKRGTTPNPIDSLIGFGAQVLPLIADAKRGTGTESAVRRQSTPNPIDEAVKLGTDAIPVITALGDMKERSTTSTRKQAPSNAKQVPRAYSTPDVPDDILKVAGAVLPLVADAKKRTVTQKQAPSNAKQVPRAYSTPDIPDDILKVAGAVLPLVADG